MPGLNNMSQVAVNELLNTPDNTDAWAALESYLRIHPEISGEIYNDGIVQAIANVNDTVLAMWRME